MFKIGHRVRLVSMTDDPDPLPSGATGEIVGVFPCSGCGKSWVTYDVDWDPPHEHRGLMPVVPPDVLRPA